MLKDSFAAKAQDGKPLSAESDHRVANNLAMVSALVRQYGRSFSRADRGLTPSEVSGAFNDVATRIDMVSRLHRLLSTVPDDSAIDLTTYLSSVCDTLATSLPGGRNLRYAYAGGRNPVTPSQALSVGLIVAEAVTNALKHAYPTGEEGPIKIHSEREKDAVVVTVTDGGVGVPEGLDPDNEAGLGFRAMQLLADKLNAALDFEPAEPGLRCVLRVPVEPETRNTAG